MSTVAAKHRDASQPATPQVAAGKFCILGAGSSGLTVAKNFQDRGIAFDCLEREADIGGSWNIANGRSSIYRSTRLISSKRLTEYADFPMPDDFPDHPGQRLICEYLRSYADHFNLRPHIEFNTGVQRVEPISQPSPMGEGGVRELVGQSRSNPASSGGIAASSSPMGIIGIRGCQATRASSMAR